MGQFGNTSLQQWKSQQDAPEAPKGLQQSAAAAGGRAKGDGQFANSSLAQATQERGYVANAQKWYTGANRQGVENGWDNAFTQKFITGQEQAAQRGTLNSYFDQDQATGVVTWDHASSDGRTDYKFGDIYEDGKKSGNIYDTFDKGTADLMMSQWLFDDDTKAQVFGSSDRDQRLGTEVERIRQQNNVDIPKAAAAAKFGKKVDARSDDFQSGWGDEGVTGAGVAGGAALGAGLGSVIPGAGTAAGAVVGGIVGGIGAWMNRDELTDQAARAYEITSLSTKESGIKAGVFTGVQEWSGFAGRMIAPLSNITHGATDEFSGNAGDGQSQFYKVDQAGKKVVPKWVQVADVAASMGDALVQFASPVGLALYTGQMSATIGGEVGSLVASGGKSFDDRRGGFDSIFTDDKGNFDASAAAAGIGKVGIDVVQLGMARGLAGRTDAMRAGAGLAPTYGTGEGILARASEKVTGVLPKWAGGPSERVAAREALAAGGREVEVGAFRYVTDASGQAVSRRMSLSILAPSEQLSALSTGALARRAAATREGAMSADDFYRGARALASGEKKWTTTVVNAMGEGYEEGLQAILEPHSHNASARGEDIFMAAAYGAAMGAGMGLGTSWHQPSADSRMQAIAQTNHLIRTGGVELTSAQWDAMDDQQKRVLSSSSGFEAEIMQAAYKQIARDQRAEETAGVVGITKLKDAIQSALTQNLAKMTDRTDGAFVVTQLHDTGEVDGNGNLLPGQMPSDAVGASGQQTKWNLINHHRGIAIQLSSLERNLEQVQTQLAADPENTDFQGRQAQIQKQVATASRTLEWAQRLDPLLDESFDRMYAPDATRETIEAEATVINQALQRAFNMEAESFDGEPLAPEDKIALSRAVSMVFARDPWDQAGSFQMLVPQVSAALTAERSDNMLEISHAILPAISGDFDGDKVRPQNQLILDDTEFANARSGAHFLGAGASVNVGVPTYEEYIVDLMSTSLNSDNATLAAYAGESMQDVARALRSRYADLGIDVALDAALERFFAAVRVGSTESRHELLDTLADRAGAELTAFARNNLSNEWLWIDHLIRSSMQKFQRTYAAVRPSIAPEGDDTAPRIHQTAEVRERKRASSATLGQTLGNLTAGDSMFRKFQKLHYAVIGSPVLSAEGIEPTPLHAQALLYEALGSGITRSEVEELRAKDEITGNVLAQLMRLSLDAQKVDDRLGAYEALSVVANLAVSDIETNEFGEEVEGPIISLAQMLLKQAVMKDRGAKDAIFDHSPELQAKHARLMSMTRPGSRNAPVNAERAFIEIVGSQQLYTLLGDDAAIFGPHLTVEQWIREYASNSEEERRAIDKQLKTEAAYLGASGVHDMPYNLDNVLREENKVSAYRAVVDAVLGVAHNRITLDATVRNPDGVERRHLNGELADRHYRTTDDFIKGHRAARQALLELGKLSPRRDGETERSQVARLLEQNPDFARDVMALIPNASANAVLVAQPDGSVNAANWVYDMFTISDSREAEMHYWRNLLLAEWNALGVSQHIGEEGEPEQKLREYGRLPRRMHRVIYQLATMKDGGTLLQEFTKQMEQATSLESFLFWVNTTPGVRGKQAPLTGWVDDTAEFDADKAQGGWTTSLPGSELREAIGQLAKSSARLVKDLAEEQAAVQADTTIRLAIRRVLRKDAGGDVTLSPGDRALHDALEKQIQLAGELAEGVGPQAMLFEISGAVRGFNAQAHTKGKNPANVEPIGAFEASRDAYADYVTNYERLIASLTATDLNAVGNSLSQVMKDGVRSMDDYGQSVVQGRPTVKAMLDLMDDPDTRPLARALLFPQVKERGIDGKLRNQLLVGKSLKELLDGSSMNSLFHRDNYLGLDAAMRYGSLVNAQARKHGGHFSFQRVVTDLVIARTSAADHALSTFEEEQMILTAVQDVALVLQQSGSIASAAVTPGIDPLADVLEEVRKAQRTMRQGQKLGLDRASAQQIDEFLTLFTSAREQELLDDVTNLTEAAAAASTNNERALIAAQIEGAQVDFDLFKSKVEMLKTDNPTRMAVEKFRIDPDDVAAQPDKKRALVTYVSMHMSVLEHASSIKETLAKLTRQMLDPTRNGQPDLTEDEWVKLSNAIVAHYLDDAVGLNLGVSVPAFPAQGSVDERYYDTSFGYLAEPLLSLESPLVQAAKDIHRRAGRLGEQTSLYDLTETLGRTLFKEYSLGAWTADIPRASMEANQRLDSASAAFAIAMAGNSPKRLAVIQAATRRTFLAPGEELLSRTSLDARALAGELFDEIDVLLPGQESVVRRPLAQVNNRFARNVTLYVPGQEPINLLAESRNLGRTWYGNSEVAAGPYVEIHLDRIKQAIEAASLKYGFRVNDAYVDIDFFHPDSQPEGAEWFNNVYFEGTSFKLDADQSESLLSTMWFKAGGISPAAQRMALDASKKGLPALQVITTPTAEDRAMAEADALTDLAGVLRAKTRIMLSPVKGFENPEPEFYNAIYKDLKLRHFVHGINESGETELWPAERVLAFQAASPNTPLPLTNPQLWVPTDSVLRSMLGEIGTQGVQRIFEDQLEIDLTQVPTYRGVTETMMTRFGRGLTGQALTLAETHVANRARQNQLVVRAMLSETERSAYDAKQKYFRAQQDEIYTERKSTFASKDGGFDANKNLKKARRRGNDMLHAEDLAFDWAKRGIPMIGPRKPTDTALSKMLLTELASTLESNEYRTGWIYEEGGRANAPAGELSEVSIGNPRGGGMRVAPDDLVILQLESFKGDLTKARKRVQWLADHGANVVLGATDGGTDMRAPVADYLESHGYERLAGSVHVYVPQTSVSRFQNKIARESSLTEMEGVSGANRAAVFLTRGVALTEGAAWINPNNERTSSIGVTGNLVPTDFLAGFNVPANPEQIARVRAHLRGLGDAEGLALLRAQAQIPDGDTSFDESFRRMLDLFDANDGVVLPQAGDPFAIGDLIPLVDGQGQVLLYRHGYRAPNRAQVDTMLAMTRPGHDGGAGVAVFSNTREPAATVHTGTVVRFNPRSGYGLSVEMQIPLQPYGNKFQLEWNGLKLIGTPMPAEIKLPQGPMFENGQGIDIISDAPTAFSKEAFKDLVDNHRSAFAFFGVDFLPDVTEFFFPGQRNDPSSQSRTREMLAAVTRMESIPVTAADEVLNAPRLNNSLVSRFPAFSTEMSNELGVGTSWTNRLNDGTVESQIASAMVVYLMTPGAQVGDVLTSGGMNNDDSASPASQSILMPRLFTQIFDNAPLGSPLRSEMNRRFNAQFKDKSHWIAENFTFGIKAADAADNLEGWLQFAEVHASGDNPIKNGMSFDESGKGAVSYHSAVTAYGAIGADTAFSYDLSKARAFAEGKGLERDLTDGGVWRLLTAVPAQDRSFQEWRKETPAESFRKGLAREAVLGFRVNIDTGDDSRWSDEQRKGYLDLAQKIVHQLGLQDKQAGVVDGWVRQILGRPHGFGEDGAEMGRLTGKESVAAAKDILWNVSNHYLPVVGAEVPQLHVHDLQLLYRANERRTRPWTPRESMDPNASPVEGWDGWVQVALGSAMMTDELFDPMYLLATDGMMHGYQHATTSMMDLPVSRSVLVTQGMYDVTTNQMLNSIDPNADLLTRDPIRLNVEQSTLAELMGGQRIGGKFRGKSVPASVAAKRREEIRKWRKDNDTPVPVDVTMRNFRKNGAEFIDNSTTTNAFYRSLINLRVGTALINPALWVSMGPEQWVRGTLDRMANLLTGESTVGATAKVAARAGLSQYTPEQLTKLNRLSSVLGQRSDFKSLLYSELMFKRPIAHGHGRIESWLEGYAKFGSKMQDPTYGMLGHTLARRYLEGALSHIHAMPSENVITTDQLVAEMMTNPQYLRKNFPEAHLAGSNSIAQLRSLKPTPLSLALRGIYEPMSASTNSATNFLGNVILKLPLLFSGYAANVATTITGLQGVSDMTAMFLDKRPKSTLIGRAQAAMRGEKDFDPESNETFDMSSVLEGIDLSRSFIRGGLTHTGLFAMGMAAGGLGLSGEDDETKRRRRAASLQGAGFVYDPRRVENDFRNSDAVFLDWLPFGFDEWFRVTPENAVGGSRSMAQPHWMLKQFISPMIGMERFFETGDFRQIGWGFEDAIGSFPIINARMWADASETANDLAGMADDEARLGGPENLTGAAHFLTTAVGTYERMLFENAFVNMLYSSWDEYDRDPYAMPAHNEDGSIRTGELGQPENSATLKPYRDADGIVHEGYASRSGGDATLHSMTENRATLAFAANMLTGLFGGDGDYFRRQMPIKTRTIEKDPTSQAFAESMIRGFSEGMGGQQNLTADELSSIWKRQAKDAGVWVDWADLDEQAKRYVSVNKMTAPMSVLDKNGREVLTKEGSKALLVGLSKGTVKVGDTALAGTFIPFETRVEIQKDWMKELVQEGLSIGLDETKAQSRMKRLWYGPSSDPSVQGLGDILWDKNISYSDKAEYNQLNTTYVIGPDGMPWATGVTRDGLLGALGIKPATRYYVSKYMENGSQNAMGTDNLLNSTDRINGINTGLRALELKPDDHIPTAEEIKDEIVKAIEEAARENYSPYASAAKTSGGGSGWRNFGSGYRRFGGGGYGGFGGFGGGGGGGGYADFQKMYALPESRAPYGDSIPFINTTNPILRRESVRRERVWSERGKLKQWQ